MERIMVGVSLKDRKSINKLDLETEWCDRHYQEHTRKQTQMGGTRGEKTWQQMDNQSHRMTKDLEAEQEQDGATTSSYM